MYASQESRGPQERTGGDGYERGYYSRWSRSSEESTKKSPKRNRIIPQTNAEDNEDALLNEFLNSEPLRERQVSTNTTAAAVHRQTSSVADSPKRSRRNGTHVFDQDAEAATLQNRKVPASHRYADESERDLEDELLRFAIKSGGHSESSREGSSGGSQYLGSVQSSTRSDLQVSRSSSGANQYVVASSESGLEEERFPTYLPVNYPIKQRGQSDTQSLYSVLTASSRQSFGNAHPVNRNFNAPYPSSAVITRRGPVNRLSSRRRSRQGSRSSLETDNSSVSKHSPGFDQDSEQPTLDSERRRSSSSRSQQAAARGNHMVVGSPETRIHSNGYRKSRSSIASHKSTHEEVSRLTIHEETKPALTSESGINLPSNLSIADSRHSPSISRSRKSSSGRGSQISRQDSGRSSKKVSMGDADSIGSATSILLRNQSRASKSSGAHSMNMADPDEEILVGDEKDLHASARRGDCEAVEQLLELGTDINCRNETDRTPIHWAAGNGHVDVLKIMLDRDANIEAADKFGMNALLWAAWFGHRKCVQMLLRAGAKSTAKNKNGYTFLHCAAQNNHMMAESILTEDLQDFDRDATDDAGRTCLHVLAKHGRKEMLEKFISLQCNVNVKDKAENTPLHLAAKYGFPDLLSILVRAGANMEDRNAEQKTALHFAAEEGKVDVVVELIKLDADVNAETEDEVCPLHLAVSGGYEEAAIALINGGADVDAGNKHNQTPLHYAVIANHAPLVQILTLHGADPNVQDARSETPLHLAAENGHFDIAEILLRANVNLSLTDQRGKTPLNVAARGSFITIVDMVLKAERHHLYLKTLMSHHTEYGSQVFENGAEVEVLNGLPKDISFKPDNSAETQHIRTLLYKLATKYLKKDEWRKLAFQWGFTDSQVQAIEEQYTGERSYREHGYRMLLIWLNGCMLRDENPIRSLFEGLVGIQRRDLAETMRSKANSMPADKSCVIS